MYLFAVDRKSSYPYFSLLSKLMKEILLIRFENREKPELSFCAKHQARKHLVLLFKTSSVKRLFKTSLVKRSCGSKLGHPSHGVNAVLLSLCWTIVFFWTLTGEYLPKRRLFWIWVQGWIIQFYWPPISVWLYPFLNLVNDLSFQLAIDLSFR